MKEKKHNGRKRGHGKPTFGQPQIFIKGCCLSPLRLFTRGTMFIYINSLIPCLFFITFFLVRKQRMLQWATITLCYELNVCLPPKFIC